MDGYKLKLNDGKLEGQIMDDSFGLNFGMDDLRSGEEEWWPPREAADSTLHS